MNELSCVTLRKVDPSKNMARQYSVAVCRDLFGTAIVVCRWGRIGRAGRSSQHVCGSLEEARTLAEELVEKRGQRGYDKVEGGGACATAPQAAASPYANALARVSAPRRRRAKSPVAGQLWLLDWVAAKTSQSFQRASAAGKPTADGLPSDGFALMRTLGKPATHADRERAMSMLTLAASLRGITLSRGTARPSASV
jgi:predicted DNA-binding WGR domain protein